MFYYFKALPKDNDLSITAHVGIACFLGALHEAMLASLMRIQTENHCNGFDLRNAWHELMEKNHQDGYREKFFQSVVKRAEQASHHFSMYFPALIAC